MGQSIEEINKACDAELLFEKTPFSKQEYINMYEIELAIKKLDRQQRQVARFHSRSVIDFPNHERREARMLQKKKERYDNGSVVFYGDLSE